MCVNAALQVSDLNKWFHCLCWTATPSQASGQVLDVTDAVTKQKVYPGVDDKHTWKGANAFRLKGCVIAQEGLTPPMHAITNARVCPFVWYGITTH